MAAAAMSSSPASPSSSTGSTRHEVFADQQDYNMQHMEDEDQYRPTVSRSKKAAMHTAHVTAACSVYSSRPGMA
jgi:hypothetical protein